MPTSAQAERAESCGAQWRVFQNRLLLAQLVRRLEALSFQVYLNRRVPPNDGGLAGGDGGHFAEAGLDFCFVVQSHDPLVVQETHETLYHVLCELVHIFFEHEGLLDER